MSSFFTSFFFFCWAWVLVWLIVLHECCHISPSWLTQRPEEATDSRLSKVFSQLSVSFQAKQLNSSFVCKLGLRCFALGDFSRKAFLIRQRWVSQQSRESTTFCRIDTVHATCQQKPHILILKQGKMNYKEVIHRTKLKNNSIDFK